MCLSFCYQDFMDQSNKPMGKVYIFIFITKTNGYEKWVFRFSNSVSTELILCYKFLNLRYMWVQHHVLYYKNSNYSEILECSIDTMTQNEKYMYLANM